MTEKNLPESIHQTGLRSPGITNPKPYAEKILAALRVPAASQRKTISVSALLSGSALFFSGWMLPAKWTFTLGFVYFLGTIIGAYIAIAFAMITIGSIISLYCRKLLTWPEDSIAGDDLMEILDQLGTLFVPLTITLVSICALVAARGPLVFSWLG